MRERVVRRKRKRGALLVRYLALGVVLLAAWVLAANTILQPYLAPPADRAERVAAVADDDAVGALASARVVLPMLTAPATPQLAAATQPATIDPVVRGAAGTLPAPAADTVSPAVTALVRLASADDANSPALAAPVSPVRLASAAPTVGGADISDAAVIAKAVEPAAKTAAPLAAASVPTPRHRPRIALVPLPRPRPGFSPVTPVSFLDRLFGGR